jgi:hypothetical protein
MFEALFFLGRYELLNADTPKHRSATCVVLFARDHGEQLFPASSSSGSSAGAINGQQEEDDSSGGGAGNECVLKFMRNRKQWERELSARGGALEPESFVGAAAGVLTAPSLHEDHPLAPAADAHRHPNMKAIRAVGHHAEKCGGCYTQPLGKGGYRCIEGCRRGGDYCSACVAKARWELSEALRQQQLAQQRFSPAHVMPVLRQHELGGEAARALGEGLRAFPFVLVLPKGEEDLEGARSVMPWV